MRHMNLGARAGLLLTLALCGCGDDDGSVNQNQNANQNNGNAVCGNGVVETGEQCDLGEANDDSAPDGCRTSCRDAFCGDGVVDSGELCDGGAADDTGACLSSCVPASCGDGHTWAGTEACDPADPENGARCAPDCSQDLALCGNNAQDAGEACDLGEANADVPNAACRESCQVPACGDGIRDDATPWLEACDCGSDIQHLPAGCITINVDGVANVCRADCSLPTCGDGLLDNLPEYGEQCDEGAANCDDSDACTCSTTCRLPACGNGSQEDYLGEECDAGAANCDDSDLCACGTTCLIPACGNGHVDHEESCDAGLANCEDSMACTCTTECSLPGCGNGVVEAYRGEECDAGLANCDEAGCACSPWCTIPRCGDGHVEAGEECDAGDAGNCDDSPLCTCAPNCTEPGCGNGVPEPYLGESCDQGTDGVNPDNCDTAGCTCSTQCQIPWIVERAGVFGGSKLRSVWTDGTNAIAVGDNGTILHRAANGTWTAASVVTPENLNAIRPAGTSLMVVGDNETALRWNGTSWLTLDPKPAGDHNYRDVAAASGSVVWLATHRVGVGGALLQYSLWNDSVTTTACRAIAYVPNITTLQFYAVGDGGLLVWYYETDWFPQTSFTTANLNGIWINAGNDMTVVGAQGTIWAAGNEWTQQASPVTADLYGVAAVGPTAYAVGNEGTILRRSGGVWAQETAFTNLNLYGVAATPGLVLAVGDQGIILRRP